VRSSETFPTSTNVVTVLGVLGFEEGDEVSFVSVKFWTGLDVRQKSVDGEGFNGALS
jgi:hypothetical protein